jgi:hypothetical protein
MLGNQKHRVRTPCRTRLAPTDRPRDLSSRPDPSAPPRPCRPAPSPGSGTTQQVGAFLAAEVKCYEKVVRDANMKAD